MDETEKRRAMVMARYGNWSQSYIDSVRKESQGGSSSAAPIRSHEKKMEVGSDVGPINVGKSKEVKRHTTRRIQKFGNPTSYQHGGRKTGDPEWSSDRALIMKKLEVFQQIRFSSHSAMGAASTMRKKHLSLEDSVGEVKGVEIGDKFQSRGEVSVIGLHKDMVKGINVLKRGGEPIATSISSSHGNPYDDSCRVRRNKPIVYTGEGGYPSTRGPLENRKAAGYTDQILNTRNRGLINSMKQKVPVRVVWGVKEGDRGAKKYIYLGLYQVVDYKYEESEHGNKVYKFMLNPLD